jgi:hypothetical protein
MTRRKPAARPWTNHDTALWHILDILAAHLSDDLDRRPEILTNFARAWGPAERIVAEGNVELYQYTSGDGGYFLAAGSGAAGLALLAGTALYSADRNRTKWRRISQGRLTVSIHGFYIADQAGLHPWSWDSVDAISVSGPGGAFLQGQSRHGSVAWAVRSDWTELLFTLWALARHPRHPQLLTGAWLPPDWMNHAQHHGYATGPQTAIIAKALPPP